MPPHSLAHKPVYITKMPWRIQHHDLCVLPDWSTLGARADESAFRSYSFMLPCLWSWAAHPFACSARMRQVGPQWQHACDKLGPIAAYRTGKHCRLLLLLQNYDTAFIASLLLHWSPAWSLKPCHLSSSRCCCAHACQRASTPAHTSIRETRPAAHVDHVYFSCKQHAVRRTAADVGKSGCGCGACSSRKVKPWHACIQEAQPHLPLLSAATIPMLR